MRHYAAKLILIAESRYDFTEKRTPFKVFWLWRRRSEADDARAGTYTAGHGMTDTIGYDEAKTVDAGVTNSVVDYAVHAYVWYRGMDEYGGASVTQVKNICCLGYEDIYGHKSDCMDGVDLPNDTGNGGKWRIRMPDGTFRRVKGVTKSDWWIGAVAHGKYMDVVPVGSVSGSSTTRYTDQYTYGGMSRVITRGGSTASATGGVSRAIALYDASHSNAGIGSRLAFRGKLIRAQGVAAYKAISEAA